MAGEWEEATLADVSTDVAYGYTESALDEKVGPRFLRITDIQNGVVDWHTVPYCPISESDHRKYRLHSGDIVVARTGNSTGENYLYCGSENAVYASYLIRFRVNQRTADPAFVWYNMRTQRWQDFINSSKTGSAQAGANAKVLGRFPLTLPPLAEQKAIAAVLGALDDKIELNRRMNATLEAMARALFQSWFVDFDPVRAKLEGRPPAALDPATAALFPKRFDHKAEGVVPTGWNLKRWGEIATLEYGKSIRDYRESSGKYRVFGTNGPIGFHDEALRDSAGIVIGRKGAYRGVHYSPEPFFVIDTAFYLKPKVALDLKWAYYELLRFDINSMDSGSAIPSTSRDDFYCIPVIVPPLEIQDAFGKIVGSWFAKVFANDHESRTLATLRDTLLPKLLSGELQATI